MQKVRQPVGMALMILAFPEAIYGVFPWGLAVAGVLFLLGLIVAVRRFSAIVWSWCLFSWAFIWPPFYLDVESGLFFQQQV